MGRDTCFFGYRSLYEVSMPSKFVIQASRMRVELDLCVKSAAQRNNHACQAHKDATW